MSLGNRVGLAMYATQDLLGGTADVLLLDHDTSETPSTGDPSQLPLVHVVGRDGRCSFSPGEVRGEGSG